MVNSITGNLDTKFLFLLTVFFLLAWIGCAHPPPARESLTHPGQLIYFGYANSRIRPCYRCHALDGRGRWFGGPSLIGLKAHDRGKILQKIRKGAGFMPAYGDALSPQEIEQLVDWLISSGP